MPEFRIMTSYELYVEFPSEYVNDKPKLQYAGKAMALDSGHWAAFTPTGQSVSDLGEVESKGTIHVFDTMPYAMGALQQWVNNEAAKENGEEVPNAWVQVGSKEVRGQD